MEHPFIDPDFFDTAGIAPDSMGVFKGRFPAMYSWFSLPPGRHSRLAAAYFELFCPTRASDIFEISGATKRKLFQYRRGYTAFSTPEAEWQAAWESRIEGFSIYFERPMLEEAAGRAFGDAPGLGWRSVLADYAPQIAFLAKDICSQAQAGYPAGFQIVETQMEALMAMLARRYSTAPDRDTRLVGIHSAVVLRAIDFVGSNLTAPLSVGMIAERSAASPAHLNKLFRAELGVSVWSYVQDQRLTAIAARLCDSDAPLDKIGRPYGYTSRAALIRIFKRKFGCTPDVYRQSMGATPAASPA